MAIFQLIGNLFKVFFFFANLWQEKDAKKSAEKKEVADKVTNAFKETDPKKRASLLNSAVGDINRL